MADTKGIVFLRTLRPNTPVIYGPDEEFEIGGSRSSLVATDDDVTIVGTGITRARGAEGRRRRSPRRESARA